MVMDKQDCVMTSYIFESQESDSFLESSSIVCWGLRVCCCCFPVLSLISQRPQEQKVLRVCKLKNYGQGLLLHLDMCPEQQGSRGTGETNKLTA